MKPKNRKFYLKGGLPKGKRQKNVPAGPLVPIKDISGLPRVLLLGDSISIGYTIPTRKRLKKIANVHRALVNCRSSSFYLSDKRLEEWLGDGQWDVIHFNCGIWDQHLVDANGRLILDVKSKNKSHGVHVRNNEEQYEKNLRKIIARLKKTNACLIMATSTPVPLFKPFGRDTYISIYNEIAKRVALENDVEINDLYGIAQPRLDLQLDGCHFNRLGNNLLADAVAEKIKAQLEKK